MFYSSCTFSNLAIDQKQWQPELSQEKLVKCKWYFFCSVLIEMWLFRINYQSIAEALCDDTETTSSESDWQMNRKLVYSSVIITWIVISWHLLMTAKLNAYQEFSKRAWVGKRFTWSIHGIYGRIQADCVSNYEVILVTWVPLQPNTKTLQSQLHALYMHV